MGEPCFNVWKALGGWGWLACCNGCQMTHAANSHADAIAWIPDHLAYSRGEQG